MAIVQPRCRCERALHIGGNSKFVAQQGGTAGWNGVVIGDRLDGKDLMVIHKLAIHIYRSVSEAVGPLIESAVGLQEAAVVDFFAVGILHDKLHPWLVQVAHFRNQEWPMSLL